MILDDPIADPACPVQKLDPRLRIVFAVLFSFAAALMQQFLSLWAALGVSVTIFFLAGIKLRFLIKRLTAFNSMVLLFWLVLPVTFPGEALYNTGPLTISRQGVLLSAAITLKANAIMLAFIALVAAIPVSVLGHALEKLFVPRKIVHILLLTYRYVFVIEQEYQKMVRAIKTRGFIPKTSMHTYKTYAYLLGMIFVRSADRAQRVHQAMICRGFDGHFRSLTRFSMKKPDYAAMSFMAAALAGLEVLEWISRL